MSGDSKSWKESRQAWDRLEAWYRNPIPEGPPAASPPDAGDGALKALEEGGVVRRLLDQVEFEAVRTARKHGKSWAEISVKLGVTRQSAWERWRDVDDAAGPPTATRAPHPDAGRQFDDDEAEARRSTSPADMGRLAEEAVRDMLENPTRAAPNISRRAARGMRRRSTVVVPNVTGMTLERANTALDRVGLIAVGTDAEPLAIVDWPDDIVTDQVPEAGARVQPGTTVMLWTKRDGGPGVREPRRPMPDPKTGRAMRDETTGEVVN